MQPCVYIYECVDVDTVYTYAHHSSNLDSCVEIYVRKLRDQASERSSPQWFRSPLSFPGCEP